MTAYLGIDIAKASFTVTLVERTTRRQATFANAPNGFAELARWLARVPTDPIHACMEASGRYGVALATALFNAGQRVSIVNPAYIKAFARTRRPRSKTDALDADLIADYCQIHQPSLWTPPDPARDELRQLTRYRQAKQRQLQQERNRRQAGALAPLVVTLIQTSIRHLQDELAAIEAAIDAHLMAHPHLRQQQQLLDTIPGIGPLTASLLIAELPDMRRFQSASQLVAYAGLDPQHHHSGTSVHKPTHISKHGNHRLRTALYFPAIVAKTHAACFQAFVRRLTQDGHPKQSIVVAVMRKLLHLVFGILKHQQPFDPDFKKKRPAFA